MQLQRNRESQLLLLEPGSWAGKGEAKRARRGGREEEGARARLTEERRTTGTRGMGEAGRVGCIGEHWLAVVGVRAGVLGVGGRWYGFQEEREGEG